MTFWWLFADVLIQTVVDKKIVRYRNAKEIIYRILNPRYHDTLQDFDLFSWARILRSEVRVQSKVDDIWSKCTVRRVELRGPNFVLRRNESGWSKKTWNPMTYLKYKSERPISSRIIHFGQNRGILNLELPTVLWFKQTLMSVTIMSTIQLLPKVSSKLTSKVLQKTIIQILKKAIILWKLWMKAMKMLMKWCKFIHSEISGRSSMVSPSRTVPQGQSDVRLTKLLKAVHRNDG